MGSPRSYQGCFGPQNYLVQPDEIRPQCLERLVGLLQEGADGVTSCIWRNEALIKAETQQWMFLPLLMSDLFKGLGF